MQPNRVSVGIFLFIGGLAAPLLYPFVPHLPTHFEDVVLGISASLLLCGAAFLSSYLLSRLKSSTRVETSGARSDPEARIAGWSRVGIRRVWAFLHKLRDLRHYAPNAMMMLASSAALNWCFEAWRLTGPDPDPIAARWMCGILLGICFPFLVLERRYSGINKNAIVDARALSSLVGIIIFNLLCFALSYLLASLDLPLSAILRKVGPAATSLVAAEILIRNLSGLALPLPAVHARQGPSGSLTAGLVRLQKPSLSALSASITRSFGIDLARSWSLRFIAAAALPALSGLVIAAWLMTGITSLGNNQRAAYEAFGQPRAIFQPGLHVHLPWPFGQLTPVDFGEVREVAIVFPAEAQQKAGPGDLGSAQGGMADPIEGPPPRSADRLWSDMHPAEATYLVASTRDNRENFEVLDVDLRVLYRTGLTDQAAHDNTYRISDSETLVRSAAAQKLTQHFSRSTLASIIAADRDRFTRTLQAEIQEHLDGLTSGIDVLGVVIEAIHPPVAAAASFQEVQASQIRAEIEVAAARGEAGSGVIKAQTQATTLRNEAEARSAEIMDRARFEAALFVSDADAAGRGGAAFLLERRLAAITRTLGPQSSVTIIDSSIAPDELPVLDYRPGTATVLLPEKEGD